MTELEAMYNELIMEHSMDSPYKHKLTPCDFEARGHNASCGDEINLQMNIKNGKISELAFSGHGCAISQSSTSIMIETLTGKTTQEAKEILQIFIDMIKRNITDEETLACLDDAIAFKNISNMPARVKCALLAWHTLLDLIVKNNL